MNRDGSKQSLWQGTVNDYQATNQWNKDTKYDVLIIGGGITGMTTALVLQEKGLNCIVAEAHNLGFGTTGGTTAHLNTLLDTPYYEIEDKFGPEAAEQVAIGAREAIDLIEGLVNKYDIDCGLAYKTAYVFAETATEAEELDKIMEANQKVSVLTELSDNIPVSIPFVKAIKVGFQAQMHATRYLHGIAAAFEQMGGVILQRCMVSAVTEKSHITAETTLGEIKANAALYATHIPPGITVYSFQCAPYRSYAMAVTLKSGQYPDGMVYDSKDPYHYLRTQEIDGTSYLIAGGYDHKTGHNENTQHSFTELEAYVRKYFDVDEVKHQWSSQYYNSIDGLPYIGVLPGNRNIFVATGYGGNGMIYGTLAAKVICTLISDEETPYAKLFNPARIKLISGFSSFVKENADVFTQFISSKFNHKQIAALAELAPGEATVAEWENKMVALYKDENGHIFALDPVCPHAGCTVQWNNAEKTWDCPCHGARFAPNGDLLNGPAQHGLTQVKL